jgi:hypothetical protein
MLRRAERGPPRGMEATPLETRMWARFPRVSPEDVDATTLPALRDAVVAWWDAWRAEARAGASKAD